MTLPPVTSNHGRAVLGLVAASRDGTESDRRKWLFRFCRDHGVPLHAVNWRQPVTRIAFSVVAAGLRKWPERAAHWLTVCTHAGQTCRARYSSESSYPE